MPRAPSRDETNRLLGEIKNEQARGVEDRAYMRQALEGIRADIRGLLDLPARMTNVETTLAANHKAHVERLAAIERDVGSLKTWRADQEGERRGARKGIVIGMAASAAGGGGIGAGAVAVLRKWGWI